MRSAISISGVSYENTPAIPRRGQIISIPAFGISETEILLARRRCIRSKVGASSPAIIFNTLTSGLENLDRVRQDRAVKGAQKIRRRGMSSVARAGSRRDLRVRRNPPDPQWTGKERSSRVQFVVNSEEGGENNILDGESRIGSFLSTYWGAQPPERPGMQTSNRCFEYGSRAGFWRLWRCYREQF